MFASSSSTAPPASLPIALDVWRRLGRHVSIRTRLRVSRALSSTLLDSGRAYVGGGGFSFAIDRDDPFQATMLLGIYDPVVEDIVRRFTAPGGVVIDGGAHLGYFALRFARLVGPAGAVHAFECDPRLAPRLRAHAALNELSWVTINECALLDTEGTIELYLPDQLGWASRLERAWDARESVRVPAVSLDAYTAKHGIEPRRVTFIKLDVEGSEPQALRGARALLEATEAAVLIEFIPERLRAMGEDPGDLIALMARCGYRPWSPQSVRDGHVELAPGTDPGVGEDVLFLKSPP